MFEGRIIGGILGVVVGDALGLPVQFMTREEVKKNPVNEMRSGGAFETPVGAWSDDSSLTLCLTKSLAKKGYNLKDIAERFLRWFSNGYITPLGYSFDIGRATRHAMENLGKGVQPLEAGPVNPEDNGNGSLMRILPAALYFASLPDQEFIQRICEVSKITHGHPRSQLGCALYALYVKELVSGENHDTAYKNMQIKASTVFKSSDLEKELHSYKRLLKGSIKELSENEIKSSGYVVDTLEAACWCFLTTRNYKEAVLRAVNLGLDTDTVGAVTGGLAGIYYGLSGIPEEWISKLIKKDWILDLAHKFAEVVAAKKITISTDTEYTEKEGDIKRSYPVMKTSNLKDIPEVQIGIKKIVLLCQTIFPETNIVKYPGSYSIKRNKKTEIKLTSKYNDDENLYIGISPEFRSVYKYLPIAKEFKDGFSIMGGKGEKHPFDGLKVHFAQVEKSLPELEVLFKVFYEALWNKAVIDKGMIKGTLKAYNPGGIDGIYNVFVQINDLIYVFNCYGEGSLKTPVPNYVLLSAVTKYLASDCEIPVEASSEDDLIKKCFELALEDAKNRHPHLFEEP